MKTIKEIKQEMLTTIRDYIIPFWGYSLFVVGDHLT